MEPFERKCNCPTTFVLGRKGGGIRAEPSVVYHLAALEAEGHHHSADEEPKVAEDGLELARLLHLLDCSEPRRQSCLTHVPVGPEDRVHGDEALHAIWMVSCDDRTDRSAPVLHHQCDVAKVELFDKGSKVRRMALQREVAIRWSLRLTETHVVRRADAKLT